MSRALDRAPELQSPTVQPAAGKHITVIIRYDGQEWIAADGIVEQIDMENETYVIPPTMNEFSGSLEFTGRKMLSITLRSGQNKQIEPGE